uniref:Heat shock protein n=1 Tax=Spodoptera frugiperda TaxID=7108 RepID=A0A7G9U6I3_SPOFR|nr:heat shock protein [Spodoptera frugiperda]
MIGLVLCALVAAAAAAPHFDYPRREFLPQLHRQARPYISDDIFDTSRFWADMSREMKEFEDMMNEFTRNFPTSTSQEGFEGNEYKITIPLTDFEEKDIVVKAREGLLMVQAIHKYKSYLDIRTLPDNVNVAGNWVFDKGVLRITFPVKSGSNSPAPVPTSTQTPSFETEQPTFGGSREEIETNSNVGVLDADVGLGRGDQDKATELKTNEIPQGNTVEATTYAVDLKDEVEFVPIKY